MFSMMPSTGTSTLRNMLRPLRASISARSCGVRLLAETTGIFTETAGGVTIATLRKLAERGDIGADERVVAVITGEGLKTLDVARDTFERWEIEPSLDDFESERADRVPAGAAR